MQQLSRHNAIDSRIALDTPERRIKRDDAMAGEQVAHARRGIERLGDADRPASARDCTRAATFTVWPK